MTTNADAQIDPQVVINDLLDQIKRLTLDNSMLRAYIANAQAAQAEGPGAAVFAPPATVPDPADAD